jgi:hypothetical protein
VSVSAKYFIFMAQTTDRRTRYARFRHLAEKRPADGSIRRIWRSF